MNASLVPRSPYKGLMPYDEADAPFFFGREPDCEIISANLQAARLTVLYGASGVGKSSVLRAGVAHALRQQALEHPTVSGLPEFGVVVYSAWRDDPIAGLLRRVADSVQGRAGGDAPETRSLVQGLQTSTERLGGDLLIILDQFEEYFLYHPYEDGDGTFAAEFPRAVNRAGLRVHFLIAIREDALAKLDRFKGRIPNLFDNYLRIEHLDRAAARSAIELPIAQYNRLQAESFSIDRDLVDQVLEQVKTGQVVLGETGRGKVMGGSAAAGPDDRIEMPYLQLVMTRLWDEEQLAGSRVLRLATLTRLGGAENIVRTHLDATMRALSAAEQDDAARVFNFLVTPSGAKIAHTVHDLALYGRIAEGELAGVLDKLAASDVRILRPVAAPPDQPQAPRYEIFHDVLAPAILDWRARFLQAQERAEAEQRLQAERAAAEQRLVAERQRSRRLWLGVVGLSLLLVAMIALAGIVRQQTVRANRAQAQAVSRELAAAANLQLDIDPELGILLAAKAVNAAHTDQAEDALRRSLAESHIQTVLRGHTAVVNNASFSPDETAAVTASADGTARVWPLASGANTDTDGLVLRGHTGAVNSAVFSPDGKWVATAGADKTARLWSLAAPSGVSSEPITLAGHTDGVYSALFSPDGKRVLTASIDGTARVWQAADGAPVAVLRGHTGEIRSAQFSPDGRHVVTAGADGTARIWDAASGQQLALLAGHTDGVRSATFSPDGRWVLTAGADKTARIWDAETGADVVDLVGHTDWVLRAAFSPDGEYAVTASGDGTARVWRLLLPSDATAETGAADLVAELRGHTDWVLGAAFSRDGRYVVTASQDGTARVWEAATGRSVAVLRGHTGPIRTAAFSADGARVITASEDGTARVWNAGITGAEMVLAGHTNSVWSANFSPDGRCVATTSGDGTARVWSTATGQSLAELRGHEGWVYQALFSPDGKLLITTGADKTARLWQPAADAGGAPGEWRQVAELRGHTGDVTGAAFSSGGKVAATVSTDRTAWLWNLPASTGAVGSQVLAPGVVLEGHRGAVLGITFSPDGQRVVTASADGTARTWRLTFDGTGQVRSATLEFELRHNSDVYIAAFSPDGARILTGSRDSLAVIWDAATGKALIELRGHARDVYSAAYSPDGAHIVTASADNTARVWEASTGAGVAELRGHTSGVYGATYSADGRWIATSSMDGTARIWDASNGRSLAVLRGDTDKVYSANFSPQENRVLTASEDGLALLYRCALCVPADALMNLVPARTTRGLTGDECRVYLHETNGCPTPAP